PSRVAERQWRYFLKLRLAPVGVYSQLPTFVHLLWEWDVSGVSLPVTRPIGRALLVANPASRPQPLAALQRLGYSCAEADDPYTGMLELCRNALAYRALIVSLASLFKEELPFIESVKRRFPHV